MAISIRETKDVKICRTVLLRVSSGMALLLFVADLFITSKDYYIFNTLYTVSQYFPVKLRQYIL